MVSVLFYGNNYVSSILTMSISQYNVMVTSKAHAFNMVVQIYLLQWIIAQW